MNPQTLTYTSRTPAQRTAPYRRPQTVSAPARRLTVPEQGKTAPERVREAMGKP